MLGDRGRGKVTKRVSAGRWTQREERRLERGLVRSMD